MSYASEIGLEVFALGLVDKNGDLRYYSGNLPRRVSSYYFGNAEFKKPEDNDIMLIINHWNAYRWINQMTHTTRPEFIKKMRKFCLSVEVEVYHNITPVNVKKTAHQTMTHQSQVMSRRGLTPHNEEVQYTYRVADILEERFKNYKVVVVDFVNDKLIPSREFFKATDKVRFRTTLELYPLI